MNITPLSDEAFAIIAQCNEANKSYGITVDPYKGNIKFVWAFKIDKEKAHREGFDEHHIHGSVSVDENFNGCPYCGAKQFYICGNCGSVVCYHGEKSVTCPSCGQHGEIEKVDAVDLKGGDY